MNKDLPQRKNTRLWGFDYNTPGAYFITICTQGKRKILSRIVAVGGDVLDAPFDDVLDAPFGDVFDAPFDDVPHVELLPHGKIADKYIVDSIDEHELFAGMGYFPDGMAEITCETGEVLAGLKEGRKDKDELIVCSNIGISVNDVVMGQAILMKAFELGLGRKLPL